VKGQLIATLRSVISQPGVNVCTYVGTYVLLFDVNFHVVKFSVVDNMAGLCTYIKNG
jgi:hypothetical protein